MPEKDELDSILGELDSAGERQGTRTLTIEIDQLRTASAEITELMLAAQELAEPDPQYFTRG